MHSFPNSLGGRNQQIIPGMRGRKQSSFICVFAVCVSSFLAAAECLSLPKQAAAEEIHTGFGIERYARLSEHNPFTVATPAIQHKKPSPLDKLILASWLKDGNREIIFVENSDTREVRAITSQPAEDNLRLIEIRLSPNPEMVEAVVSDGERQVGVKFRFDSRTPAGQSSAATDLNEEYPALRAKQNQAGLEPQLVVPVAGNATTQRQPPVQKIYPGLPRVHSEGNPVAKKTLLPWAVRKGLSKGAVPDESNPHAMRSQP
jgi:hypothetical protein